MLVASAASSAPDRAGPSPRGPADCSPLKRDAPESSPRRAGAAAAGCGSQCRLTRQSTGSAPPSGLKARGRYRSSGSSSGGRTTATTTEGLADCTEPPLPKPARSNKTEAGSYPAALRTAPVIPGRAQQGWVGRRYSVSCSAVGG